MASVRYYETPLGFEFHPTATQLLQYLDEYIRCGTTQNWIAVKELYGPNAEPADVFSDDSLYWIDNEGAPTVKTAYVLTWVTRKTSNSTRIGRTAGSGTWRGQRKKDIKDDSGNAIGSTCTYKYESKNGDPTAWSMCEYSLNNPTIENINDFVICKIKKKSRIAPAQPPSTADSIVTQQQTPSPNMVDPTLPSDDEFMDIEIDYDLLADPEW